MNWDDAWTATRQWLPFASRTAAFGTVSLLLGPLTKDRAASLWAMRRWCQSSARGLSIGIEASGVENVPRPPFIYFSNHQSLLDILVLGAVLPHDFKWAAKRSLMRIPFLGWHLKLAGHVPVERGRGQAAKIVDRFEAVLRNEKPLLVFPEGTRSDDGVLKPFKNGGFIAAVRAGVPAVPVAIHGTHLLMEKGAGRTRTDRTVSVAIGKPVHVRREGDEASRVDDLRDRTFAALRDLQTTLGGPAAASSPASPSKRRSAVAST